MASCIFLASFESCPKIQAMKNPTSCFLFILTMVALPIYPRASAALELDKEVVLVNYDSTAGDKLGEFPSRAVIAQFIERIGQGKPKSIVIKFFFDSMGNESDSKLLEASFGTTRILLQASINPEPPTSRFLDERFYYKGSVGKLKPMVSGREGWLPIKQFSDKAAKVCFVDVARPELVPMFTTFQNMPVQSMYSCILADAFGAGEMILNGDSAQFGDYALPLDDAGQAKISLTDLRLPTAISALDVLDGKVDCKVFENKIAVFIYTGNKSPTINVRGTAVKLHQLFSVQLRDLFAAVKPRNKTD